MDGEKIDCGVFFFDVIVDRKGITYLRTFQAKEKTRLIKSLVIDPSMLLIDSQEGEAWVETRGGKVERIILLKQAWIGGIVTRVTKDAITVAFAELKTDGTFPAHWGPPVSMVRMKDIAYVHPRNGVMYVHPISSDKKGEKPSFSGVNPPPTINPHVSPATNPIIPGYPQVDSSSHQYLSGDYQNQQGAYQPIHGQTHVNPYGSLPAKPLATPPNPRQPQNPQWPQGYQNLGGYGLPPQPSHEQMPPNLTVPTQPVERQFQGVSSIQIATGAPSRQEQHPQPIESNHFEITQEMMNSVHDPSREDFHTRTPEIPIAIGRHRLPIGLLQEEFKWNELMVQKLQLLAERYSTWRRSRGDGNCFYRCVGVLLCEHYCRPDTPIQELFMIYKAMNEQCQPFLLMNDSQEMLSNMKMWQRLLKDILGTRTRKENAFQRLQYFLQRSKFDRAIIIAMRNYTAAYFRLHANDPEVSEFLFEGPEPVIQEIMEYGKEAEGIALKFTAQAFNIILHIFTVDNKSGKTSETTYGPAINGWYPSMHLLHLPGHYNYLVPRVWDNADRYDFASNTYTPVPTGGIIDYEEFKPET